MSPRNTNGRGIKRAVIYLRVSTQRQADSGRGGRDQGEKGFSITEQQEVCEAKAAQLSATVVEVYIEEAESARVADRPELMRMMARIKELRDVDYVIVHKLDRFSRDRFDEAMLQMELRKAGARFISATENINGDTPGERALHGFLAVFADYYSANLGHEVKKGLRQKIKNGGSSGMARIGYRNVREQIGYHSVAAVDEDPERGPLVRWMWEAFATGQWTIRTISAELRKRGLTTRGNSKAPSHPIDDSTVHRMLTNRYYLGKVTFEGVEYDGNHPALVDQVTFDKVQAILRARNQTGEKPQKHIHYLKGDLACARCGGRFGIMSPTNRHGTTYSYFYCLNRQKRKNCLQRTAPTQKIEKEIEKFWYSVRFPKLDIDALRARLTTKIETELGSTSQQVPVQKRRIAKLEKERKKLLEAFYAEAISKELLKEEQSRITRQIAEAEQLVDDHSLQAERAYQFLEDLLTFCDDPHLLYLCADEPIRQMLNRAVVKKFWVWDEQVLTAELTPEFAAIQQRLTEVAAVTTQSDERSDSVPAPQRQDEAAGTLMPTTMPRDAGDHAEGEDGPVYLREVGTVCSPLSRYLKKINNTENPRLTWGDEGSNLTNLVGRVGLEPTAKGL